LHIGITSIATVKDYRNAFFVSCTDVLTCALAQFADQGYLEVDGSFEWDNDYPNPVRIPRLLLMSACA
jgi:hypothetical protein